MTTDISTGSLADFSLAENSCSGGREKARKIIHIDQKMVRAELGELVKGTVEETLNALLDEEADRLCGAKVTSVIPSARITVAASGSESCRPRRVRSRCRFLSSAPCRLKAPLSSVTADESAVWRKR